MKDVMDAILTRRSIRKYTDQEVKDEVVDKLLNAAMHAPSAGNEKPWHFIILRDRKVMMKINEMSPRGHSSSLRSTPLAIVICGDPRLEVFEGYWSQDCAAATENLLIAANGLGLGAVWMGLYPWEDLMTPLQDILDIPLEIKPFAIIGLGYPNEEKKPINRFIEDRVHYGKW